MGNETPERCSGPPVFKGTQHSLGGEKCGSQGEIALGITSMIGNGGYGVRNRLFGGRGV